MFALTVDGHDILATANGPDTLGRAGVSRTHIMRVNSAEGSDGPPDPHKPVRGV